MRRMERARAAGRVWGIDTGHDLMITEPQAVAELLWNRIHSRCS